VREDEFDKIVGGEGGSGEGSDDDLINGHHDEEEAADGELRDGYSRALVVDVLGAVCITCALNGVQGEVYHGRNGGDTNGENVGREVGGDLGWAHFGEDVAESIKEVKERWIEPEMEDKKN